MFVFFFHFPSFSPCLPLAFLIFSPPLWNFHVFLPTKFVSVIHVRVNIRNNVKKGTTFFSLSLSPSKRPGGHAIVLPNKTSSYIWVTIPVDWVILHWWCLWCGRTGGRAVGRTYGNVTTQEPGLPKFLGCRGYQIFLPLVLRYKRCKDSLTWWVVLFPPFDLKISFRFPGFPK